MNCLLVVKDLIKVEEVVHLMFSTLKTISISTMQIYMMLYRSSHSSIQSFLAWRVALMQIANKISCIVCIETFVPHIVSWCLNKKMNGRQRFNVLNVFLGVYLLYTPKMNGRKTKVNYTHKE